MPRPHLYHGHHHCHHAHHAHHDHHDHHDEDDQDDRDHHDHHADHDDHNGNDGRADDKEVWARHASLPKNMLCRKKFLKTFTLGIWTYIKSFGLVLDLKLFIFRNDLIF